MFLNPLMAGLSMSRVRISLFWMGAMMTSSLMSPVAGLLLDKYGVRKLGFVQAVLYSLVFLGLTYVRSHAQFFALLFSLRFLGPVILELMATTTINRWFVKTRAKACAIYTLCSTSFLLQPVIFHSLIHAFGWRYVYRSMSITVLVVLGMCTLLLYDSPEACGMLPDGKEATPAPSEGESNCEPKLNPTESREDDISEQQEFTFAEASKTKELWIVALSYCAFDVFWAGTNL
jgi:MFS family permease